MIAPELNAVTDARKCECKNSGGNGRSLTRWTAGGAILAALGICSACCLLPFVLLSLGIAGAWVGALDSLAPYKWVFIALTVALLGYGFYAVYGTPRRACAAGSNCESCRPSRAIRITLWIATLLAIGGIVFEYLEPLLTR